MKKIARHCGLTAMLCMAPAMLLAADFDGSRQLICATSEVHDCDAGESCSRGLPHRIGVPQFMRIDLAKEEIIGPKRSASIKAIERSPQQILLHGVELGMAWTLALNTENGRLSATIVNRENAIVVFGACTPL